MAVSRGGRVEQVSGRGAFTLKSSAPAVENACRSIYYAKFLEYSVGKADGKVELKRGRTRTPRKAPQCMRVPSHLPWLTSGWAGSSGRSTDGSVVTHDRFLGLCGNQAQPAGSGMLAEPDHSHRCPARRAQAAATSGKPLSAKRRDHRLRGRGPP